MAAKITTMKAIESLRPTMKMLQSVRPTIDTLAATLALPSLIPRMQALARLASRRRRQRSIMAGTNGVLVSVVTILVTVGVAAMLYSMTRRRGVEADDVRAKLSEALFREPRLADLPITALVHVPLWWRSPVTVEVSGPVASAELRDAVLQALRAELSRNGLAARIEDLIVVDPPEFERARNAVVPE